MKKKIWQPKTTLVMMGLFGFLSVMMISTLYIDPHFYTLEFGDSKLEKVQFLVHEINDVRNSNETINTSLAEFSSISPENEDKTDLIDKSPKSSRKNESIKNCKKMKNTTGTIIIPTKTNITNEECLNGVVFTAWFTYQKDPQRNKKVSETFDYIWNFYTTAQFLELCVAIFHDHLSPDFVSKHETNRITFQKIVPAKDYSTNDLRFIVYQEYLKYYPYDWILMTDASDVYFNNNPFFHMSQNKQNVSLYFSPDVGTYKTNEWMTNKMKQCYSDRIRSWTHEWDLSIFNAGVWGGHTSAVSCMLNCIRYDLMTDLKGKGNCDMGAVNWCSRFGNCSSKEDLERDNVKELFVNPFRRECDKKIYSIIHNKC